MDFLNPPVSLPIQITSLISNVAENMWYARDRISHTKSDGFYSIQPDELNVLSELEQSGFERVGCGVGRVVYRFPQDTGLENHVVKIGRFGRNPVEIGMFQNRNEIECWNMLNKQGMEDEYPILPMKTWHESYRWCVMRYGTPINNVSHVDNENGVTRVKEELKSCVAINQIEITEENVVWYDGKPYLCDYGRVNTNVYPFNEYDDKLAIQ